MNSYKKRKQREEVRRILHAMRLELAAQAAVSLMGDAGRPVFSVGDMLKSCQNATR